MLPNYYPQPMLLFLPGYAWNPRRRQENPEGGSSSYWWEGKALGSPIIANEKKNKNKTGRRKAWQMKSRHDVFVQTQVVVTQTGMKMTALLCEGLFLLQTMGRGKALNMAWVLQLSPGVHGVGRKPERFAAFSQALPPNHIAAGRRRKHCPILVWGPELGSSVYGISRRANTVKLLTIIHVGKPMTIVKAEKGKSGKTNAAWRQWSEHSSWW